MRPQRRRSRVRRPRALLASADNLLHLPTRSELLVSAYVTAGGARLMLLHDGRGEDGVR